VCIAAHLRDAGEKESEGGKRFRSDRAESGAIKKAAEGFKYIDPAHLHEFFAADLLADQAVLVARSPCSRPSRTNGSSVPHSSWGELKKARTCG
jgi:hypothetical protein